MTSIQEHSVFLQSGAMPDDNMEIASEHGQEDLDIDLDFEPGHGDEDEVLEDANSEPVQDEDYDILLSSPVLGHDEIMDDEGNTLFAMNENPYENAHTEAIDLADTSAVTQAAVDFNGAYDDILSGPINTTGSFEAKWEHVQAEVGSPGASHVEFNQPETTESQNGTEVEKNADADEHHDPRTSPPIQPSGDDGTPTDVSHPEEKVYQHELTPKSIMEPHEETISKVGEAGAAEYDVQGGDEVGPENTEESGVATAKRVVVTYLNTDYALVASSESDDPDSYFLKDDSLTRAPISEFLSALKEVIIEDIAADDELCLAVDDFGVEINETSTSMFQMTFANIIDLHASLLHNDGISKPGPLYISLGTKPDCSKRLNSLAAGAAEGKGLSELVTWKEGSDSVQEEHSEYVENDLAPEIDHTEQEAFSDGPLESRRDASVEESESQTVEASGFDSETLVYGEVSSEHEATDPANLFAEAGEAEAQRLAKDEDEDDLIDYEDEDYVQTHQSPVLADSLTDQTAEYEDRIEQPQRRSISRPVEEAPTDEQSGADHYEATHSNTDQGLVPEDGNTVGYKIDDESGELEGHDTTRYEEHIDPLGDDGSVHDSETHHEDDNEIPTTLESSSHENLIGDDASAPFDFPTDEAEINQSDAVDTNDYLDLTVSEEINLGDGPTDSEYHGIENDNPGADNPEMEEVGLHVDELDYEDAPDAPESNESEQTLLHDDVETAKDDEIDYEDEDEPIVTNLVEVKASAPASNGVTSKRSRTDGDDILDRELQDTKRLRS